MYSTLDGAKKCAKELKHLFDDSGFNYPLNKCQAALAKAGGYRDWHELENLLGHNPRPNEPGGFRKRLLATLPEPCRPPTLAWLDREPLEAAPDPKAPRRWYRDVFPYLLAAYGFHRGQTALLRLGSGPGQRLRESIVFGLLMSTNGGSRVVPQLEPHTMALVFRGSIAELFGDDANHRNFDRELKTLSDAGILDIQKNRVRVLCEDKDAVIARVNDRRVGNAQYWDVQGGDELVNALHQALAAVGVRNALRVADAIARFGSEAYVTPAGPVLELLSKLAEEGELEVFSKTYRLFATIRPGNAGFLRDTVPGKISSLYFARHRRLDARRIVSWTQRNPEWPQTLKVAVEEPIRFVTTVEAMAAAIPEIAA